MADDGNERPRSKSPWRVPVAVRRFPVASGELPQEVPPRVSPTPLLAGSLVVLSIGLALLYGAWVAGSALAAAASVATALFWVRRARPAAGAPRAERALLLDASGLLLEVPGAPRQVLLRPGRPFGATLVTTRARDRLVLALTAETGVFLVGTDASPEARGLLGRHLARASALPSEGSGLEAVGPDGAPLDLAPDDFAALVDALEDRDAACTRRLYLSDARGAPVRLDGDEMRLGGARVDLAAPLEWRAFIFQEPLGGAVAVYQATWIQQETTEVVLVALLPSLALEPAQREPTGLPELDRASARDLRLAVAPLGDAPPRAQRVAIDRLFMMPLRATLDRAPRASRGVRARA